MVVSDVPPDPNVEFTDLLTSPSNHLRFLNPSKEALETYFDTALEKPNDVAQLNILATDSNLKSLFEKFKIRSAAADLADRSLIEIQSLRSEYHDSYVLAEDCLIVLAGPESHIGKIPAVEEPFLNSLNSVYDSLYQDSEKYTFDAPPISKVKQSLSDQVSPEATSEFSTLISADLYLPKTTDVITLALLAGSRANALFSDISSWGESMGFATAPTFSRRRKNLEREGIIETRALESKMGRPQSELNIKEPEQQFSAEELLSRVA